MGQPQSTEGEGRAQPSEQRQAAEDIPYTQYSQNRPSTEVQKQVTSSIKGVTVVNPKPETELRPTKPPEIKKLEQIHRFWPLLKSSIEYSPAQEKIKDGLDYKEIQGMCLRYQQHLTECATIVGTEQRALASRLKDTEMFTAGIAQQMIKRQERMVRVANHLERVNEVSATLEKIQAALDHCVPLAQRLNILLPEERRLEPFRLHPTVDDDVDGAAETVADSQPEHLVAEVEEERTWPRS